MKTITDTLRSGEARPQDDWNDIAECAAERIESLEYLVVSLWHFIENNTEATGKKKDTEAFFKLRERVRNI